MSDFLTKYGVADWSLGENLENLAKHQPQSVAIFQNRILLAEKSPNICETAEKYVSQNFLQTRYQTQLTLKNPAKNAETSKIVAVYDPAHENFKNLPEQTSIVDILATIHRVKPVSNFAKIENNFVSPVLAGKTFKYKSYQEYIAIRYGSKSKSGQQVTQIVNNLKEKLVKKEDQPVEKAKPSSVVTKTENPKKKMVIDEPKPEVKTEKPAKKAAKISNMFSKKSEASPKRVAKQEVEKVVSPPKKAKKEVAKKDYQPEPEISIFGGDSSEEEKVTEKAQKGKNVAKKPKKATIMDSSDEEEKPEPETKSKPAKKQVTSKNFKSIESSSDEDEELNSDPEAKISKETKNLKLSSQENPADEIDSDKENGNPNIKYITQKVYETKTFEDEDGFIVTKQVPVMKKVAVKTNKLGKNSPTAKQKLVTVESEEYENVKIMPKKEKIKAVPKKKSSSGKKNQSIASFFTKK